MIDFDDLNLKISLILVILILMGNLHFMLSIVEHEKRFIISGPRSDCFQIRVSTVSHFICIFSRHLKDQFAQSFGRPKQHLGCLKFKTFTVPYLSQSISTYGGRCMVKIEAKFLHESTGPGNEIPKLTIFLRN